MQVKCCHPRNKDTSIVPDETRIFNLALSKVKRADAVVKFLYCAKCWWQGCAQRKGEGRPTLNDKVNVVVLHGGREHANPLSKLLLEMLPSPKACGAMAIQEYTVETKQAILQCIEREGPHPMPSGTKLNNLAIVKETT